MRRKVVFIIGIISLILGIFLLDKCKNEKDFIYVIPKIKNFEVLSKNIGEYQIIPLEKENTKISQRNFLNGSLFYNVPNGKYLLKGEYKNEKKEVIFIKERDWEKVQIDLEGQSFSKYQEIFLNILTGFLIAFNIFIFKSVKDRLDREKPLKIIFGLILAKMLFSFRGGFQTDFLILSEYIITRVLCYLIIFYLLDNIISKKYKKFRIAIYIAAGVVYCYNFLFALIVYSPQFYVYMLENYIELLRFIRDLRNIIDLTRIVFVISAFEFLLKRKTIPRKEYLFWAVIGITYFIMEFFQEIFPKERNLYYFIELMEIVFIYWWLVFNVLKSYTKQTGRVIRYTLGVTLAYISLFYYKSLTEPTVILGTMLLLDFYTTTVEKIMLQKNENVEKIYNRMCLVQGTKAFENQLEKEIKRNIDVEDVLVKIFSDFDEYEQYIIDNPGDKNIYIPKDRVLLTGYDSAFRVQFNENRYIGAIFIKETENSLNFEDYNFLIELSNTISSAMSRIRINSLYMELS